MSKIKLFLECNIRDAKDVVVDGTGYVYGEGKTPREAIKSARQVTDEPINYGTSYEMPNVIVSDIPDTIYYDKDEFIKELATLAGVKVTKLFSDDLFFKGYTMELKED